MDCPICCTATKKTISCPKCEFKICHTCVINYAKSTKKESIDCVSCKQVWDHKFICKSLPLSLVYGKLKAEREKALLPASLNIKMSRLKINTHFKRPKVTFKDR